MNFEKILKAKFAAVAASATATPLHQVILGDEALPAALAYIRGLEEQGYLRGGHLALDGMKVGRVAKNAGDPVQILRDMMSRTETGVVLINNIYEAGANTPHLVDAIITELFAKKNPPAIVLAGEQEPMEKFLRKNADFAKRLGVPDNPLQVISLKR